MNEYFGRALCTGIGIGKAAVLSRPASSPPRTPAQESARLASAVKLCLAQLEARDALISEHGELAEILTEGDFLEDIRRRIEAGANAARAVADAARCADEEHRAAAGRLIDALGGHYDDLSALPANTVLIARSLTAAEAISADIDNLCGAALEEEACPPLEHICKSLRIPLIDCCTGLCADKGETAIADGQRGIVTLSPTVERIRDDSRRIAELIKADISPAQPCGRSCYIHVCCAAEAGSLTHLPKEGFVFDGGELAILSEEARRAELCDIIALGGKLLFPDLPHALFLRSLRDIFAHIDALRSMSYVVFDADALMAQLTPAGFCALAHALRYVLAAAKDARLIVKCLDADTLFLIARDFPDVGLCSYPHALFACSSQ